MWHGRPARDGFGPQAGRLCHITGKDYAASPSCAGVSRLRLRLSGFSAEGAIQNSLGQAKGRFRPVAQP